MLIGAVIRAKSGTDRAGRS